MAFPIIQSTNVTDNGANTSHPINMPAGISVGDLLIVFFATDGDNTITNWGGFSELDQQDDGKDIFGAIGYKIAVGSDTLTITTSVLEPSSAIMYRIDGWESSFIPEISIYATSTTIYPNSLILTPSWVQDDTLWITTCMYDSNSIITAYPTNYSLSQLNEKGGAAQDCGVGVAGYNLNASSQNPDSFTLDDAEQWVAWTIAIAPSGATAPAGGYSVGIDRGINRGIL